MTTRVCENLAPLPVENAITIAKVGSSRNKVSDLWQLYRTGKISKEDMKTRLMRRCIDNLGNWYFPEKMHTSVDQDWKERKLKELLAYNSATVEWLQGLISYAGLETERSKIYAKIGDFRTVIYQQNEALRQLRTIKRATTPGLNL